MQKRLAIIGQGVKVLDQENRGEGGFNEPPCPFLKGLIIYNIRNIHNINYKVNEDLNSKTSKDAVINIGLQVLNVSF